MPAAINTVRACFILFMCCVHIHVFSQSIQKKDTLRAIQRKQIGALRIESPPKLDGLLDESFWSNCEIAGDFSQYIPYNMAKPTFPTEARFAYDNTALYAAVILYDDHPDSIYREMGLRDQADLVISDLFSIDLLPYNDGMNMYEFKISASGLQTDTKYSVTNPPDVTWDAIWDCAVKITDSGWTAEVKIPFSALRFPDVEEQVWGMNIWRSVIRKNEWSIWSPADNKVQNVFSQYGVLRGIKNIKPPLRLSFFPYLSGYLANKPGSKSWSNSVRGGMDVKYGISDSYTLDMTLIPDFGQVEADDIILNLSPFEVKYDEKRQFFTEGTEMFDKCDLFYSRRVGSQPRNFERAYDSLQPGEKVVKNPEETRLINATKITGRNANELGVGFFNAMTTNTWANIEDTLSGKTRKLMTQPFTNYNMLILDQSLWSSSYVSLVNTNVLTGEDGYSANVTGSEFRLATKSNTYAAFGRINVSQKYNRGSQPDFGHHYVASFEKTSGNFQFEVQRYELSDRYDPNDMGYLEVNNQVSNAVQAQYIIFDPVWRINKQYNTLTFEQSMLYAPRKHAYFEVEYTNNTQFRDNSQLSLEADLFPAERHDYYEPRVPGRVYKMPWYYGLALQATSDSRKNIYVSLEGGFLDSPDDGRHAYIFSLSPRVRFSDRLRLSLSHEYYLELGDFGWVDTQYSELDIPSIFFGKRDVTTISNLLSASYIFSIRSSLTMRVRHYWSRADYSTFFLLREDGYLQPDVYSANHDISFNVFNIDLVYTWQFAPGSELSAVWKNDIHTVRDDIVGGFFRNFDETVSAPQTNSFSLKILYYLDYQGLKKKKMQKADD
jgi:hypothetical protein